VSCHMADQINAMGQFYERLGHRVVVSESACWYEVQPRVFHCFPNFRLVEPSEEEIDSLMGRYNLRALRYPTSLSSFGFLSNVAVNTNRDYDLKDLHQKARNQTRRGLENCRVEQIDFDYLAEHGLALNQDTAARQGFDNLYADADYWRRYCAAAKQSEGVTAWGAFVEDELAAFLVSIEVDGWAEWVVNHSSNVLRKKYPNNALAFKAAQYFFQQKNCAGICYGLGSLEPTPSLDHFKQRMGWTLQPIKQRLVFSKKMRLMFSLATESCLKIAIALFPRNYTVRKVAAMVRLYRQQSSELPPDEDSSAASGETK